MWENFSCVSSARRDGEARWTDLHKSGCILLISYLISGVLLMASLLSYLKLHRGLNNPLVLGFRGLCATAGVDPERHTERQHPVRQALRRGEVPPCAGCLRPYP